MFAGFEKCKKIPSGISMFTPQNMVIKSIPPLIILMEKIYMLINAEPVVDDGDGLDEDCRRYIGATDVQQNLWRQILIKLGQ